MQHLWKIINLLFALAIPFFFITLNLALAANLPALYEYGFNKYNAVQSTGLEPQELKYIARALPDYFSSGGKEEPISIRIRGKELFNERERIHMIDVKNLIRLDYFLLFVLTAFIISYTVAKAYIFKEGGWKVYFRLLLFGSVITVGLIVALGLFLALDFEGFFLAFHLVSFANEFWMLDPSRDYLIRLFTGGFFFDTALFIALAIAIEAAIVALASLFFLYKTGRPRLAKEPGTPSQ